MRGLRSISILIGILLVLFSLSMASAQSPVNMSIFIDNDSFTVFVPSGGLVSLQGLGFRVMVDGISQSYPLAGFSSFAVPFNTLPTPICFQLKRAGAAPVLPTQCPPNITNAQPLSDANIFWFDSISGIRRVVTILQGDTPFTFCPSGISQCDFTYFPPTYTPTATITLTAMPSQTPTASIGNCTAQVSTDGRNANVRVGPGRSYRVITTSPDGFALPAIGASSDANWIQVQVVIEEEQLGWIHSELLSPLDNCELPILDVVVRDSPPPTVGATDPDTTPPTIVDDVVNGGAMMLPLNPLPPSNMPADVAAYCAALGGTLADGSTDTCAVTPGTNGDEDGNGLVQVGWNELCYTLYGDAYRYARQDGSGSWACYNS